MENGKHIEGAGSPREPKQEEERRLLAHSLLSSGRLSQASPASTSRMNNVQLEEEVKAALAMRDFFRRSDLRPRSQDSAPGITPFPLVVDTKPLSHSHHDEHQEAKAVEQVEAEEGVRKPDPAPVAINAKSQKDPRGDVQTAIDGAEAVKVQVEAYSLRIKSELAEARVAMLEAERRYRAMEAESKESAERLARAIREALQQVESLAG